LGNFSFREISVVPVEGTNIILLAYDASVVPENVTAVSTELVEISYDTRWECKVEKEPHWRRMYQACYNEVTINVKIQRWCRGAGGFMSKT
jgi:hypothetical protein